MHEIRKLYAVAFHFMCMGTSCISGVNARHDFEQIVFIRWLSNKILSEYVLHSTIRVYLNEIYRRVVHSTTRVCPNENIRGLSTVLSDSVQMKISEGCPQHYRSLSK